MNKKFKLLGDIYLKEDVTLNLEDNVLQILDKHAGGLKGKQIKFVQIGGVLGDCLIGKNLLRPINSFDEPLLMNTIMYFSDLFCPVDYFRFLTRFLIRELKVDTHRTRELNKLIEDIANKKARLTHIQILRDMSIEKVNTKAERLINNIFNFLINNFEDEFNEHILDHKCKNGICRGLMVSQCINACPAEVNIPGYVELMKSGRDNDAYSLMRKTNPLSLICGKVCARPCETRCRRGEIESTVGVRALQRYASEISLNIDNFTETKLPLNGKNVAIVGSGPVGLSAAYFLARTGYKVTIFEALNVIGGMLASCIPEYRLPYKDLIKEIDTITNLGVEIKTGVKIGDKISLASLKLAYDSIILATGAHIGNKIPNYPFKEIETAVSLLSDVKLNNRNTIGEVVAVIGGGDVAMDAARTSLRIGAKKVYVISLEEWNKMPASIEERNFAIEEGIKFQSGYGIENITKNKDNNLSLIIQKCTQVFDVYNKFCPQYDHKNLKKLTVNSIILAIGQKPDLSYIENKLDTKRAFLSIDKNTFMTSEEGIFAAGDVTKISIAAQAIADGKKAAYSVDDYLGGNGLFVGEDIKIPEPQLNITTWDVPLTCEETKVPKDLNNNFDEITHTYTRKEALIEANRCLRCDRNSTRPLLLRPMRNKE